MPRLENFQMTSIVEIPVAARYKNEAANIIQYDLGSRYYLNHNLHYNLNVLGNDIIISGFNITSNIDSNNNCIFTISKGQAIIDSSLIENLSDIQLTCNIDIYDPDGYLIIVLHYHYYENSPSYSAIKLYYIRNSGNIYPNEFNSNYDRIIIAKYNFNKVQHTLSKSDITFNTNQVINIVGKNYDIYPVSYLFKTQFTKLNSFKDIYERIYYTG